MMILDPNGMAASTSEVTGAEDAVDHQLAKEAEEHDEKVALLDFRAGRQEPKAVPLSLVARLEEIDVKSVEMSNDKLVVQYRGKLMPRVKIDDSYDIKESGRQSILVFFDDERSMGLVVDEIVDIVEEDFDVEISSSRDGFLGSAVVGDQATEIIDVGFFLTLAFADWFGREDTKAFGDTAERNLLLVDDSPFFRNMLTPLLEVAGYSVTAANDPDEALQCLENDHDFDVIISDIEMPVMDGFEFAEKVKNDDRWKMTPMIALSSHTSPRDFERGREVGFSDYAAKFDRDALLQTMTQTLSSTAEIQ